MDVINRWLTHHELFSFISCVSRSRWLQPVHLPFAAGVHGHGPGRLVRALWQRDLGQGVYRQADESVQVLWVRVLWLARLRKRCDQGNARLPDRHEATEGAAQEAQGCGQAVLEKCVCDIGKVGETKVQWRITMRNCANISLQWRREKINSHEGKEDEGGWERGKTRKRSVLILIFFLHLRFTSCYIIIIIILHIFSGYQTTRLLDQSRSGERENFKKRPRYLNWISISKRSSRRFVVLSRTIYLPTVAITILTITITYVGGVKEQSFWINATREPWTLFYKMKIFYILSAHWRRESFREHLNEFVKVTNTSVIILFALIYCIHT